MDFIPHATPSIAAASPGQPSVMGLYLPSFRCPEVNQEAHAPSTWCLEPTQYLYTKYFLLQWLDKLHSVTSDVLSLTTYCFSAAWWGELSVRCSNTTSCRQASASNMPNLSDPPFVLFPWLSLVAVFALIETSIFPNQQFPWYACHKF